MKKSEKYQGPLTTQEALKGIKNCFNNAKQLFAEAKILLQNNSTTRASFLLLSALEEISKPQILVLIHRTPESQEDKRKARWDNFYNHAHKYGVGIAHRYLSKAKNFEETVKMANNALGAGNELSAFREEMLYVGFDKETLTWKEPTPITPEELSSLFALVEETLQRTESYIACGLYSEKALEISKEHYKETELKIPYSPKISGEGFEVAKNISEIHNNFFKKLKDVGIQPPNPD